MAQRTYENLSFLMILVLVGLRIFDSAVMEMSKDFQLALIMQGLFILFLAVSAAKESLRICQVPLVLGAVFTIIIFVTQQLTPEDEELAPFKALILICYLLGCVLRLMVGPVSLDPIIDQQVGPRGVGVNKFYSKDNFVLAFHPIFESHRDTDRFRRPTPYHPFGTATAREQGRIFEFLSKGKVKAQTLHTLDHLSLPAVYKAEYGLDSEKLPVIIFSHGYGSTGGAEFSGFLTEMAKHGYIVLAIYHNDRSCVYTEKASGEAVLFDTSFEPETPEARASQAAIREAEISSLIDEALKPGFLQEKLGFPPGVEVDPSKIIMSGHSFGGGVAIGASVRDSRIAACFALDPWMLCYQGQKLTWREGVSLNIVHTSEFYGWLPSEIDKITCQVDPSKLNQVILENSAHLDMTDNSTLTFLELFIVQKIIGLKFVTMRRGKASTYLLNAWLAVKFLQEQGLGSKLVASRCPAAEKKVEELGDQLAYEKRAPQ